MNEAQPARARPATAGSGVNEAQPAAGGSAGDEGADAPGASRAGISIRRAERVAQVMVDEPAMTVVASVPDGDAVVLTDSGELIWHAVPDSSSDGVSMARLVDTVAREAGVEAHQIAGDIEAFVTELERHGLVERRSLPHETTA